jgi:3-polyprenyl-4-hydroxybenzoate decarboxylase
LGFGNCTITELFVEKKGPALLFDGIKGYTKGYRVTSNVVMTPRRQRIAFGIPEEMPEVEVIRDWRISLADISDTIKEVKPAL